MPPPVPCTMRHRNRSQTEFAKPKTQNAAADALRLTSSAGRRPYRSETRPQIGAETSCATKNDAIIMPMVVGDA